MDTIDLNTVGDISVGFLSFFEGNKHIPFKIQRIYYIYGVPKDSRRGFHAHKELQQLAWCPYGDITIILDDGNSKESIRLNDPSCGLIITKGLWREMVWNKADSVLCVAASELYDENDYIRNYDEFLHYVKEGYWNEA